MPCAYLFYTGRALVLLAIADDPVASISALALKSGLTQRSVSRILQRLLEDGMISREWDGHRMRSLILDPQEGVPVTIPLAGPEHIGPLLHLLATVDEDEGASG